VTNNNGFCIGWLDLLTSPVITIGYNSSQWVTRSSLLDCECLSFYCDWLGSGLLTLGLRMNDECRMTTHLWINPSRAEQSRAVAYCRQAASTVILGIEPHWDPWPYICSVSRHLFFSSFFVPPLIRRERLGFFIIGVPLLHLSTRGHIKVGDIYILYIFTKHKLTLSSTIYRDICQCRIVQQPMPQLI
jgi:hypothetical protein